VIVMLRIVAGLLAAVLAVLPFCAEAQREAPCLRRDRDDPARHVRSTTPSSLCWVPIRNALDVLESDGRLRRVSLLAARSRDGLLSEPTAGARHLCDGASDFGPLYRSSDPSRGGGIGVEVVGLLSRAAFLVTSVCYNRLHHWGGRRFGQTGNLRSWSKAQEGDCAITGATTIEIAQPKELARGKMAVTADREEGVAAGAICPAGPR